MWPSKKKKLNYISDCLFENIFYKKSFNIILIMELKVCGLSGQMVGSTLSLPKRPSMAVGIWRIFSTANTNAKIEVEGRREELWKLLKMGHTGEFFKRRDQWRRHPLLTSNLRQATPGLGIALVAFGIYLVGEQVYNRVIAPSPSHRQQSPASSSHWSWG